MIRKDGVSHRHERNLRYWRAGCVERRTSGSGGGGRRSTSNGNSSAPYPTHLDVRSSPKPCGNALRLLTGEVVAPPESNVYGIHFRPRQTRKQYHSLPRKGKGRVKYQVNDELQGFHKGDLVLVKGKYVKQINSIYSNGYLAFPRVKGEPSQALPRDCQILEREGTILWEQVG